MKDEELTIDIAMFEAIEEAVEARPDAWQLLNALTYQCSRLYDGKPGDEPPAGVGLGERDVDFLAQIPGAHQRGQRPVDPFGAGAPTRRVGGSAPDSQ